jgi:hypothetical protein
MDAYLTYAAAQDTNALQCSFWFDVSPISLPQSLDMIITWLSVSTRCAFTPSLMETYKPEPEERNTRKLGIVHETDASFSSWLAR